MNKLKRVCNREDSQELTTAFHTVNHTQVPTNGITSQTFDYSEYDEAGICHFQIEDSEGDDSVDTPTFDLKSDDSLPVATYGVSSTSLLAEATTQTTVTPLPTRTTLDSSSSLTSFTVSTTLPTTSRTSLSSTAVSSSTPSTPTSSSSPPQPLTTAAKAGISIGSIFCAVALVIAILLAYNVLARQKARKRQKQDTMNAPEQNPQSTLPEIGDEGAYNEINGLGRPHELYGIPMAELEWAPRHEIDVSRG